MSMRTTAPGPVAGAETPVEIYALSCFGWGLAGAVALKADKLRWIPGQKSARLVVFFTFLSLFRLSVLVFELMHVHFAAIA